MPIATSERASCRLEQDLLLALQCKRRDECAPTAQPEAAQDTKARSICWRFRILNGSGGNSQTQIVGVGRQLPKPERESRITAGFGTAAFRACPFFFARACTNPKCPRVRLAEQISDVSEMACVTSSSCRSGTVYCTSGAYVEHKPDLAEWYCLLLSRRGTTLGCGHNGR